VTPVVMERWLQRVRDRLEDADAERELYHLDGMSSSEAELLARLERRGGLT
jgi:sirohydrochlorin ferrochelatase